MVSVESAQSSEDGWDWFDTSRDLDRRDDSETLRAFTRCFSGRDGELVLGHLRRTVLDRRLGPETSNAKLRFVEGQRSIVARILAMAEHAHS